MVASDEEFAADLLRGADEIALFLFGDRELRRKVYHLAATSHLPVFKLGSMICARRSVLRKWVENQEEFHSGKGSQPSATRKNWEPSGSRSKPN